MITKKRGVKLENRELLSDKQERHIQKLVTDSMPDELKLNFALWTRKAEKEWAEKNENKVALFFLSSYSPEINPDEYLNCDLKQGLSAKRNPLKIKISYKTCRATYESAYK